MANGHRFSAFWLRRHKFRLRIFSFFLAFILIVGGRLIYQIVPEEILYLLVFVWSRLVK